MLVILVRREVDFMKFVYVIRFNDGSGQHVKSFGVTVTGGEVHLTFDPFEALYFGSWEEAVAVASFIVFHVDEDFADKFEVVDYIM